MINTALLRPRNLVVIVLIALIARVLCTPVFNFIERNASLPPSEDTADNG